VISTDRPPTPPSQLSLSFEPEAAGRVAPAIARGQYDSTAAVTSIALFADCPRRYYLSRYLGWEAQRGAVVTADEPERDNLDATEFGRQVHAILSGAPPSDAHPDAIGLAARFTASELGLESARATYVEREFDFLLAAEDIILRGQIDLWFDDTIVDYKTDDVTAYEAPLRAKSYELQLQLYALAVARLTGTPARRALLYFLRPAVAIPVDLSPPALAAALDAVRAFRRAQESLDFPLREAPRCARCPYFRGLCPAPVSP
jgi:CRISPR/Cas system-associated exonuclease Cas4 (RecB family)